MFSKFNIILILLVIFNVAICEDYVRPPIRYHSQTDSGEYNYGYDTGSSGSHQFHHESRSLINSIGSLNRLQETTYKPSFWPQYRKPQASARTNVMTAQPHLIRRYRQNSGDNSRIYLAGRDYGHSSANREPIPIHRIESPRPPTIISTSNISISPRSTNSRQLIPEMRSIVHTAPRASLTPPTMYSSRRIPNPSASGYSAPYSAPPVNLASYPTFYSGRDTPSPASISSIPYSSSENIVAPDPVIYSGRDFPSPSTSVSSVPYSAPYSVPASGNVLGPNPVIYSGRGIPSPSAAARLRGLSLRNSN